MTPGGPPAREERSRPGLRNRAHRPVADGLRPPLPDAARWVPTVGMMMAGPTPRRAGGGQQEIPLADALDAPEVLRRPLDFPAVSGEDHDLEANVPFEVDMTGRADVLPPTMLGGREAPLDVGRPMVVQDHDGANRVRIGVPQGGRRCRAPDEEPDRVRPAPRVALLHPPVERRQDLGFQRDRRPNHSPRWGCLPAALRHGEGTVGGPGPNAICSYPLYR